MVRAVGIFVDVTVASLIKTVIETVDISCCPAGVISRQLNHPLLDVQPPALTGGCNLVDAALLVSVVYQ